MYQPSKLKVDALDHNGAFGHGLDSHGDHYVGRQLVRVGLGWDLAMLSHLLAEHGEQRRDDGDHVGLATNQHLQLAFDGDIQAARRPSFPALQTSFRSSSTVGMSSDTVGWIGTAQRSVSTD